MGNINLLDVESGVKLFNSEGHTAGVNFIAFSPDGNRFVTTSFDKTIRIWDAGSGEELLVLDVPETPVFFVFSEDGSDLVTAEVDVSEVVLDIIRPATGKSASINLRTWYSAPWNPYDYPGDDSMPFTQRYNLWSIEQHKKKQLREKALATP